MRTQLLSLKKMSRAWIIVMSLAPFPLAAAPKETSDLLFATHWYASATLSPDAEKVAWVELRPERGPDPFE